MSVDPGVTALSRPNHPARLAALFLLAAAAAGVVLGAALALAWLLRQERASEVAGIAAGRDVDAPEGLIVVIPVDDAETFEELTGFAPVLPAWLPDATGRAPVYSVTQPDEFGTRDGRIAFQARDGVTTEGVAGPTVVLVEARGAPGDGVDGSLKRLRSGNGRTIVSTFACGDLVIEAQLYFSPAPAAGEEYVTPYMRETAERFVDGMIAECA